MSASRPHAQFTVLDEEYEPIEVDGEPLMIIPDYQYPFVDVTSPSNTVTHEPVNDSMDSVVQHMGAGVRTLNVQGICYLDEANLIDDLNEDGYIHMITDRRIGYYVVNNAETRPKGDGGGKRSSTSQRRYDYTLKLSEISGRSPTAED